MFQKMLGLLYGATLPVKGIGWEELRYGLSAGVHS